MSLAQSRSVSSRCRVAKPIVVSPRKTPRTTSRAGRSAPTIEAASSGRSDSRKLGPMWLRTRPKMRQVTSRRAKRQSPFVRARGSKGPAQDLAPAIGALIAGADSEYPSRVIADLRTLVDRRQLLVDFAWRELRARYKGSALGFAWNFVNPLLQLVVFWILFGVVLRTRPITASGEQPYAIFLFVGLLPWTFFATSLQSGASAILANAPLVKKVRMPLQLLPAASVLSALANFLLSFLVLLAILALFGPRHPEGLAPQWDALAYSAGVAIVLFVVGFWYFDRAKDDFESAL